MECTNISFTFVAVVITNVIKTMPKIQYKVDIKATMEAMSAGETLLLALSEAVTLEGIRTAASRLRPRIYSVNKCSQGAQITRKS